MQGWQVQDLGGGGYGASRCRRPAITVAVPSRKASPLSAAVTRQPAFAPSRKKSHTHARIPFPGPQKEKEQREFAAAAEQQEPYFARPVDPATTGGVGKYLKAAALGPASVAELPAKKQKTKGSGYSDFSGW